MARKRECVIPSPRRTGWFGCRRYREGRSLSGASDKSLTKRTRMINTSPARGAAK